MKDRIGEPTLTLMIDHPEQNEDYPMEYAQLAEQTLDLKHAIRSQNSKKIVEELSAANTLFWEAQKIYKDRRKRALELLSDRKLTDLSEEERHDFNALTSFHDIVEAHYELVQAACMVGDIITAHDVLQSMDGIFQTENYPHVLAVALDNRRNILDEYQAKVWAATLHAFAVAHVDIRRPSRERKTSIDEPEVLERETQEVRDVVADYPELLKQFEQAIAQTDA